LRLFHWLCATEIPPACDLRHCGWELVGLENTEPARGSVALAHRARMDAHAWTRLRDASPAPAHDRILLLGVGDSVERARLLGLGFGDVLGDQPALREVDARATRLVAQAGMLPAQREIGPLRLELLARDGFVADRPLALHPREFALLWRLTDTLGLAVAKRALLSEVWRLCHVPDTNSLAVHVFRLRAKLAASGLHGWVQTAPDGGYMLAPPDRPAIPLPGGGGSEDDLITSGQAGAHEHEA
jgi:DNA-binding response OmpR family regulator